MSNRVNGADELLPANRLVNARRRVNRARRFPANTCPASRHLHVIAESLAAGRPYPMLHEEPHHCAGTMLAVLEALFKARTQLARLNAEVTGLGRNRSSDD